MPPKELYNLLRNCKQDKLRPQEVKFMRYFEDKRYESLQNFKLNKLDDKTDDLNFLV